MAGGGRLAVRGGQRLVQGLRRPLSYSVATASGAVDSFWPFFRPKVQYQVTTAVYWVEPRPFVHNVLVDGAEGFLESGTLRGAIETILFVGALEAGPGLGPRIRNGLRTHCFQSSGSSPVSCITHGPAHTPGGTTDGSFEAIVFLDGVSQLPGAPGFGTVAPSRAVTRFVTNAEGKTVDVGRTLDRIARGERFPHRNDGTIFKNREGHLPAKPEGYYREYVYSTPNVPGPGPQRIIIGNGGEMFFTPDHYRTFVPLNSGG